MRNAFAMMSLLFVVMLAGRAGADEIRDDREVFDAEEMVVTATMTEKIMKDAPGAIEVISTREIEEMNAQTVAEALDEAASLVVTTETGRQMRPSIRGTGDKHTLVLIDGRRLAAGFKDLLGLEQVPVDLIHHIEVVRGPASALYGSDAIGGVINIITRQPTRNLALGATAQYGQNSYHEGEETIGRGYVGKSSERFGTFLAGGYQKRNGFDRDNVTPQDSDTFKLESAGGRFTFSLGEGHALLAGFETTELETEGLRDLENMDRERMVDDERWNGFLQYDGQLDRFSTMLRWNHSEQKNDIDIDPATSMIPGTIGDESNSERWLDQVESRISGLFFDRHLVTVGSEYRVEGRKDDASLDDDVQNLSVYAQDEYQIIDPLYLVLGCRWDHHSDFASEWTPRASAAYHLMDNLRLKASYGRGFRAPGFMELYVPTYMRRGREIYEPNRNLDPEISDSYEAGIEGEYGPFQGRLMWFRNEFDDLIDAVYYASTGMKQNRKDYYRYQNISEATMEGVEFEGRLKLPYGFAMAGNMTYLDTEDKDTGKDLEGRPDYKGSLKLSYCQPSAGWAANIRLNYMGERYYTDEMEDDVLLVDAYAARNITRQLKVFTGVDNVFNVGTDLDPMFWYAGISFDY
ncbi:TonB-dependent receptor plug domain-containing protein [Trichloromonas sp.]|uniref:TonB-dependent receptor plug domain-containing protein n=1 Tax=Trichloromonas sp. TaxID=3069249 RepID=UPI002A3DD754|nr:TonB-dependent receptor [Trichloromonas sp.]